MDETLSSRGGASIKKVMKTRNSPISFFIDGEHGRGDVTKDWNTIKPYLRSGDLIVFHDMNIKSVRKAWVGTIKSTIPPTRELFFRIGRHILAVFYDTDTIPAGDESLEPITIKLESEMDWDTEKVRDIPEWRNSEKPWDQYPEKALLSSSESHLLYDTGKRLGDGNYANLGTYTGASAAFLAMGMKAAGSKGKVFAVDDFSLKNKLEAYPQRMVDHFADFGLHDHLTVCKGLTEPVGIRLRDNEEKFRFVFIDAGHRYTDALSDFYIWSPMIDKDGELAFHDVEYTNVNKVIEEEVLKDWKLVRHVWRTKVFKRK